MLCPFRKVWIICSIPSADLHKSSDLLSKLRLMRYQNCPTRLIRKRERPGSNSKRRCQFASKSRCLIKTESLTIYGTAIEGIRSRLYSWKRLIMLELDCDLVWRSCQPTGLATGQIVYSWSNMLGAIVFVKYQCLVQPLSEVSHQFGIGLVSSLQDDLWPGRPLRPTIVSPTRWTASIGRKCPAFLSILPAWSRPALWPDSRCNLQLSAGSRVVHSIVTVWQW